MLQIRDEMKTFVLAGHETSASMLNWSLFELLENNDLMDKVRSAVLHVPSAVRSFLCIWNVLECIVVRTRSVQHSTERSIIMFPDGRGPRRGRPTALEDTKWPARTTSSRPLSFP